MSARDIKQKIKSISNTRKITKAMEMVSVSKMRKANERMEAGKHYATKIKTVINHLVKGNLEYKHPYLVECKEIKRVGIIVTSTDRGLCGGLNTNLFKVIVDKVSELKESGIDVSICTLGVKGGVFFKRVNANIIACLTRVGDNPPLADVIGPVEVMLAEYDKGNLDAIYFAHNKFINTMNLEPTLTQIVPALEYASGEVENTNWDYIYEPSAKVLLDRLLRRYIETQVYQGVIENLACEQAARMVAMKSASDNASNLIEESQLAYNKARQAAITQELSEIVSGASAV